MPLPELHLPALWVVCPLLLAASLVRATASLAQHAWLHFVD